MIKNDEKWAKIIIFDGFWKLVLVFEGVPIIIFDKKTHFLIKKEPLISLFLFLRKCVSLPYFTWFFDFLKKKGQKVTQNAIVFLSSFWTPHFRHLVLIFRGTSWKHHFSPCLAGGFFDKNRKKHEKRAWQKAGNWHKTP